MDSEFLISNYEENIEIPDLRKMPVRELSFTSESHKWFLDLRTLAGYKGTYTTKEPESKVNLDDCVERYKKFPPSVRKEWAEKAEKNELSSSGLPLYMDRLIMGKEDEFEMEQTKYCYLAGLKHKTSKQKMEGKINDIQAELNKTTQDILGKLKDIVSDYKQIEQI